MRTKPVMAEKMICLRCSAFLEYKGERLICSQCGQSYPVVDGIPIILRDKTAQIPDEDIKRYDELAKQEYVYTKYTGIRRICHNHPIEKIKTTNYNLVAPYLRGARVLEVGCGMGQLTEMLGKVSEEMVAFDISWENIRYAFEHIALDNASFFVGNVLEIPYPDDFFDVAVSSEVLEHVPDHHGAIAEMKRVVKAKGKICISVPNAVMALYPSSVIIGLLKHPISWYKQLRREVDWTQGHYDRPILPWVLQGWMRKHELRILNHQTRIFYYAKRPYIDFVLWLEKRSAKIEPLFRMFVSFTDRIVESRVPVLKWLGTRQFILVEKG